MDFPCAATVTHAAAPHGVDSSQNFSAEAIAGSAPRLRSRQPDCGVSLLPDELVVEVLGHVSLDDLASASQVCRRWHALGRSTGWVASMRDFTAWSVRAGSAPMSMAAFHQALAQASGLSTGCRGEALERLAAKLPCLPAAEWKKCLASLLLQAAHCPAPAFYRILGAITSARVTRAGKVDAWTSPAMSIEELINEVLKAVTHFPVAARAVVLAAACQYIRSTNLRLDLSRVTTAHALSWTEAQMEGEDAYGFAGRLWEIVMLHLPSRQLTECLSHFNMHCLPFMSNAYPGQKCEDEIVASASAIIGLGLGGRQWLDMLVHRDHCGVPWLYHACTGGRFREIRAYVGAMKRLGLSCAELAHLFAARNRSGRPLLSVLFCRAIESGDMRKALEWMDILINEAGLPEAETVALLRSHFQRKPDAEFKDCDGESDAFPVFWIDPSHVMPFNGLSLIDSFFCDFLSAKMKDYMIKILASSLPDTAKRDVLRLGFPDRSRFLRMSRALRIYCAAVHESSLPDAMKRELTSPLRTRFDPTCYVQ